MKSIGLIEDDESQREIFAAYFRASASFSVLFAVGDVGDAIKIKNLKPDILLLDVDLPSGSGIEAIPVISRSFPGTRIIILSSLKDANLTRLAIQNGAQGYLLKTNTLDYIHELLMHIDGEGLPFSTETIAHLVKPGSAEQETILSKRELEAWYLSYTR